MARYSVSLFGALELRKDGERVVVPGRNEKRLLALLCLSPGRIWPRRQIASLLWPDAEFEVSGNRLRTALVALRKVFDEVDFVQGDAQTLAANFEQVETDLARAKRLRKGLGMANEPADDAKILGQLLDVIEPGLLPDIDDEWVEGDRQDWRLKTLDALQRRAELAFSMENYEVACSTSERALLEFPQDEVAWSIYLRAMAKRNLGSEAYRHFSAVRKRILDDSGETSPHLIQLAKSVRDGALAPVKELPQLDPEAQDLILRAFRQMLLLNARDAIRVVTTDAFRMQLSRNPAAAVDLLESIIAATEGDDPDRISLHLMALRAHYIQGHAEAVFQLSDWLLQRNLDKFQRPVTMVMRSFSHFTIREYDQAFHYIDQAIALSDGLSPAQAQVARAERASYLWHCGRDDEAIAEYLVTYEEIKDAPEEQVGFGPAAVTYNIGWFYAVRDEFEMAKPWLERSCSLSAIRNYADYLALAEPAYGYVMVRLGQIEEGSQLILKGLTRCFRSENSRSLELSLDPAAAALAFLGHHSLALGLIDWATKIRRVHRHEYSDFESRFIDKVKLMCGKAKPDPKLIQAKNNRAVLERVFAALNAD